MPPRFTVVICTYNRGGILPGAIESVLDQTFGDRGLVVDDGSTDATRTSVETFTDASLSLPLQGQCGAVGGGKPGVAAAQGEFVIFLDDDDRVVPQWLERFARVIDVEGCTVVSCGSSSSIGGTRVTRLPETWVRIDNCRVAYAGSSTLTRARDLAWEGRRDPREPPHRVPARLLPMCRAGVGASGSSTSTCC